LAANIIYLDRNESNYGPAPKCFEVIKHIDLTILCQYSRDFKKQIKGELSKRLAADYGLNEDQIILGYGSEDLLKQIVHCYLNKGEILFIPRYSWWYYKALAAEVEGTSIEFPLYADDNSYYYDVESLLNMYHARKPKLVLISSPNNPTGNSIEVDELKNIIKHMKDSIIILDEAYAMFKNPDYSYVSDLIKEYDNLIILRTFSKYFALAGIRIGFALIGRELKIFEKFSSRYLGYNRLTELIALAALDSPEYYSRITQKINSDKLMFIEEFNKLSGFKPYKSDANFILVEMNKELIPELKEYLAERGLIIKFMNEEELNSHMRITIGTQEENKKLMDAIKKFMLVTA
jgi:histidinol-phosphate aminotransferase